MIGHNSKCLKPNLVGSSNETEVTIEGQNAKALLDTGRCVSTISDAFYRNKLAHLDLQPITGILNIECADGQNLPYLGLVEADLSVVGIPMDHIQHCLFLVVPQSKYSEDVPILLGTNVLSEFMSTCKSVLGEKYLQNSSLFTPWYLTFRCMTIREKMLKKNKNRLAVVRSAENRTVLIKPNSSLSIKGYTNHEIEYRPVCAILEHTKDSILFPDIDITPILVNYQYKGNEVISVHVSNITTRTVAISPNAILGELQPVVVYQLQSNNLTEKENLDFMDKLTIGNSELSDDQLKQLKDLIKAHQDLFSKGDTDIGHYTGVRHKINLTDDVPFKQRYRRIPPAMIDEVRSHIEQLLAAGVIRKSHSPFASNVVLVRKKDNHLRMCVDYRMLNKRTIKDSYALPRIEEILDTISGAKYFTVLDMKSGYHQVEIEEAHKERTAFTLGPLGFYEFNRLPFGLSNSPATYQRLMEDCLSDLNMKICFVYLDDLIIFSDTFEEHIERLDIVFNRLRECNLKLATKKCNFLKDKVKFVGFIVSEDGISTDPEKVDKVKNWPTPTCPEDVRQFVAFAGFYRRFIQDFSKVVRPLADLMPLQNKKKSRRKVITSNWNWGPDQDEAFDKLKTLMTSAPILAYSDYSLPFEVHVDASSEGLGTVLCQVQDGKSRVISFGSRALNKAEKNYHTMKLEFLALKWAVTEKFNDYLYGNKFTVMTDNNPLTYVLTTAKLDATGNRWMSALAAYDFNIVYKTGRTNIDADTMSRHPANKNSSHNEKNIIDVDSMRALCNCVQHPPFIETIAMSTVDIMEATESIGYPMAQIDIREIRQQQRQDSVLSFWIMAVKDKTLPKKNKIPNSREHVALFRTFRSLKMIRGVLYREIVEDGKNKKQLVLPAFYVEQALKGVHDDMGHPGRDRTLSILRDRFFWPGMMAYTESWVKNCDRCLRRKSATNIKAPLVNISSSYPLELVGMDYLTLEPSKGGIGNVLVITDHFTRYAMAIPTRNQTAKTTAEAFFNNFVVHYGLPARIHTDQGANFESDLIKELCLLTGIKKSRTTVYHPMSNGMTERFNRTLMGMLGTLEPEQKQDWKKYIAPLVHAYNSTRHESTGYSPFELMFGRTPRLPVDLVFGINTELDNGQTTHSDYVMELRERLKKSYEIVQKAANEARNKHKQV